MDSNYLFSDESYVDELNSELLTACENGNLKTVKYLLSYPYIDINIKDKNGDTPLILASKSCNVDLLKAVLSHPDTNINAQGNFSFTALVYPIRNWDYETVEALLSHPELDINIQLKGYNCSALMLAVFGSTEQIVKMILSHPNIDVNNANDNGATPIGFAIYLKYDEIANLFDLNTINSDSLKILDLPKKSSIDKVIYSLYCLKSSRWLNMF